MNEACVEKFAPRATKFLGVREINGRHWKMHSIVYGERGFDASRFEDGLMKAVRDVPKADEKKGRPDAGFVILHQGKNAEYVVVCWWDRENEMPVCVWVRDEKAWRAARDGESFC
ncbi:MAG TPA: hypothetical protein VG711_12660, partial [Phycisphaerales bacterium]|nr:hypothetical protein [Phycisphaerales bacterium]